MLTEAVGVEGAVEGEVEVEVVVGAVNALSVVATAYAGILEGLDNSMSSS